MAEYGNEEEEDIVIGPELTKVVKKNEKEFGRIARNMQKQLARLQKKLSKTQKENEKLRADIVDSKKQCDIMNDECTERNEDLKTVNTNYTEKKDDKSWNELVEQIVERHQANNEDLQAANHKMNGVENMNKNWQKEIKRISKNAQDAANANDKELLIEEMQARRQELKTLQDVMKGDADAQELDEMLNDLKDRHNIQSGNDPSAKDDEKISDKNALKDNQNWNKLMNKICNDYKDAKGIKWLKELNGLYLMEMEDRISDLRELKDIFDQKFIEKAGDDAIEGKVKELTTSIQKRHKDTESKVKNALPETDVPSKQSQNDKQISAFKLGNQNWRKEVSSVAKKIFVDEM